uniref:PP1c_bdg domain-containing protein n=1 Tax=Anopheles atroparvus TaxID=41427 RepID=A0A182ILC7_ANOAO
MQEAKYIPWSGSSYSPKDKMLMVPADEKGGDLQVGDLKQNVGGGYAPGKRTSIVENVLNVITRFFAGPSDTKRRGQPPEPYASEKETPCAKQILSATATMPIFETKKDGTGRLTVPLDYESTADDIAMTPAGVYVEDMPRGERNCSRSAGLRKRRKHQSKGTQESTSGGGGGGGGESAKVGGKNRKDKKRHNLRMDIVNDSLALSMDDCYGYDYREAEFEDAIGSASLSQCCLSSSFSPSSIGSVSSFHDALQDALVMEACMQESFGVGPSPSVEISTAPPTRQQDTVTRRSSTTPAPAVGERVGEPKCDIESDRSGFVMFTDYEVFMTPSASPARRRPPLGLCKAFTYVWRRQCSDEEDDDDEEEEEEEDNEENNSEDVTEDEFEYDDEECGDEDDDSVVFCEELDDNDDSNSSSGFEEKKVRFNMKPVVHVMRAWDFAYRQARKGDWEMAARDRERFRKRIDDLEPVLGPALQSNVRDKIYTERFSAQILPT